MTETRTCDQCGKHLITHRADARFCNELCRARWNNKRRSEGAGTDIRIAGTDRGVGSRGGNVRSVDEARILQSESEERDRWRLVMEEQIHRTLLGTGYFHVDDLDPLEVPPIASEVKGTLINSVRARGYMKSTEVRRKVAHAAANARKAPIYKITEKGRAELPALLEDTRREIAGVEGEGSRSSDVPNDDPGHSLDSGDAGSLLPGSGAGVESSQESPRADLPADCASTASPDHPTDYESPGEKPAQLFPESSYEKLQDVA